MTIHQDIFVKGLTYKGHYSGGSVRGTIVGGKAAGWLLITISSIIISPQVVAAVGSFSRFKDIHRTQKIEEHLCFVSCIKLLYLSSGVVYPFCTFHFFCRLQLTRILRDHIGSGHVEG